MLKNLLVTLLLVATSSIAQSEVTVVSSIRPLQLIAHAILDESDSSISLLDYSDSSHDFELSPQDRLRIEQTDVLLWIDASFEVQLAPLMAGLSSQKPVITASTLDSMTLHRFEGQVLDPHLWLDPDNAYRIARALVDELSKLVPARADFYGQRLLRFQQKLTTNWQAINEKLAANSSGSYMVYHQAYRYFESALGIHNAGALVSNPEVEPGMREILALRAEISDVGPACVLMEPDSSMALVDTLVQNPQTKRVSIDLLGYAIADSEDAYLNLLQTVAAGFQSCFATNN